jgi:ribose 5-phosphate isomerase A
LLTHSADCILTIVDASKLVEKLGSFFPIPVEVLPCAWLTVQKAITSFGGKSDLRLTTGKDGPLVTDQGNFILDAFFPKNMEWLPLDSALDLLPGVLGHGLFLRYTAKTKVLVGESGTIRVIS